MNDCCEKCKNGFMVDRIGGPKFLCSNDSCKCHTPEESWVSTLTDIMLDICETENCCAISDRVLMKGVVKHRLTELIKETLATQKNTIKKMIEKSRKSESCSLLEDLGYHSKDCWDDCWAAKNYNAALQDILHKLDDV